MIALEKNGLQDVAYYADDYIKDCLTTGLMIHWIKQI